jgi:hypothetical protein
MDIISNVVSSVIVRFTETSLPNEYLIKKALPNCRARVGYRVVIRREKAATFFDRKHSARLRCDAGSLCIVCDIAKIMFASPRPIKYVLVRNIKLAWLISLVIKKYS